MENWTTKRRTYLINNSHDVFAVSTEDVEREISQEMYTLSLHKPIGFVFLSYQKLELEGIALSSIDYA